MTFAMPGGWNTQWIAKVLRKRIQVHRARSSADHAGKMAVPLRRTIPATTKRLRLIGRNHNRMSQASTMPNISQSFYEAPRANIKAIRCIARGRGRHRTSGRLKNRIQSQTQQWRSLLPEVQHQGNFCRGWIWWISTKFLFSPFRDALKFAMEEVTTSVLEWHDLIRRAQCGQRPEDGPDIARSTIWRFEPRHKPKTLGLCLI